MLMKLTQGQYYNIAIFLSEMFSVKKVSQYRNIEWKNIA